MKGKGKVHPRTGHEGPEGEQRYSSSLFLTSVLDGRGVVVTAKLRPLYSRERDPVSIVLEAVWAREPVWRGAQNLAPPSGFDPRTVQPVTSRYTDYDIPAHYTTILHLRNGGK